MSCHCTFNNYLHAVFKPNLYSELRRYLARLSPYIFHMQVSSWVCLYLLSVVLHYRPWREHSSGTGCVCSALSPQPGSSDGSL